MRSGFINIGGGFKVQYDRSLSTQKVFQSTMRCGFINIGGGFKVQ